MENIIVTGDNGVSGTWTILYPDNKAIFIKTPIKKERSYTKKEKYISRLDYPTFVQFLEIAVNDGFNGVVYLERPLNNPGRYEATISAIRCLEATLIAIENLGLQVEIIDSKKWQSTLLPGIKGSGNLKQASMMKGLELFPNHAKLIKKHKDADSLLIAYYVRNYLLKSEK